VIALVVFTDGRVDCVEDTIRSATKQLHGPVTRRLINDDSDDEDYRAWLSDRFGPLGFELIPADDGRQGFGGAIRHAWNFLATVTEPFVFHLEDDFTFERPVDLDEMMTVLTEQQHLAQLALRRQPWNDEERQAGGIIEQHPGDYLQCADVEGHRWVEHRRFFTTNPCLYRRALIKAVWPRGGESEGRFTHQLLSSPRLRFGFWGHRDDAPWVTHIGTDRVGTGY
jgi:hypothetical protein